MRKLFELLNLIFILNVVASFELSSESFRGVQSISEGSFIVAGGESELLNDEIEVNEKVEVDSRGEQRNEIFRSGVELKESLEKDEAKAWNELEVDDTENLKKWGTGGAFYRPRPPVILPPGGGGGGHGRGSSSKSTAMSFLKLLIVIAVLFKLF